MRRVSDGRSYRGAGVCTALLAGVLAATGCGPTTPATAPPTAPAVARVAPATLATFWTGFTATDQASLEAALRLLLEAPEIADAPFGAEWSMPGAAAVQNGAFVTWSLADGTTIAFDAGSFRPLAASIDAVAADEPDEAKRLERRLELYGLIDRVGVRLWEASEAIAAPGGGLFGESGAARRSRELALFDIRSHGLILRLIVQDFLEKAPPDRIDAADLARRKSELLALRRRMLSEAPDSGAR